MIKTVVGLEALDLSSFQMKMMPHVPRMQWTERSAINNIFIHQGKFFRVPSLMVMFPLQALLGRPLRINFAFEKARGVPVVVPRFSDVRHLNRP